MPCRNNEGPSKCGHWTVDSGHPPGGDSITNTFYCLVLWLPCAHSIQHSHRASSGSFCLSRSSFAAHTDSGCGDHCSATTAIDLPSFPPKCCNLAICSSTAFNRTADMTMLNHDEGCLAVQIASQKSDWIQSRDGRQTSPDCYISRLWIPKVHRQ